MTIKFFTSAFLWQIDIDGREKLPIQALLEVPLKDE